jgi:hypothetical protein
MARVENPTFSSAADTAYLDVTIPPTAVPGDEIVIAIAFYWNRSITWSDTVNQVMSADDGSIREIRLVRRVLDGSEGAAMRATWNISTSAEAWAYIVSDVDWAGATGFVAYMNEAKPRIYLPLTKDSLTTDEKLWLFTGWQIDETSTFTPVAANNDSWDNTEVGAGTDRLFMASKVSSQQSFVGPGDFPYWSSDGAFTNLLTVGFYVDTTEIQVGIPTSELARHGDSLLAYMKKNMGVAASEVVSALNEVNGITSPPRKEYKEARDTAFGINGH